MRDQIETWAERELEDCNIEGSLKGGEKNVEAFRYCMRKQRVWKLSTFLLYCFTVTAAYLISFFPLFLSTRFINTDRTSLLWLRYLYISIPFFLVQNFYALFILIWDLFFFFFFRLFVFVFISTIKLYITKSWNVAFNAITLTLRHISCHVIFFKKKKFSFNLKMVFTVFSPINSA